MGNLYIVRHGQSMANLERICSGSINYDCPLSDLGLEQAENAGKRLANIPFNWVITSRLTRAKHTAEAILWHNQFSPEHRVENQAFDERSMGTVEGKYISDVITEHSEDAYNSWFSNLHAKPPNGETFFNVYNRVVPFFQEHVEPLMAQNNVLLVAHYGTLQMLSCYLEGAPLESFFEFHFDNCKAICYEYAD